MTKEYPDWVYDEMARRMNANRVSAYDANLCRVLVANNHPSNAEFAKLIHETQEAPEDPYLPIARKAAAERFLRKGNSAKFVQCVAAGEHDTHAYVQVSLTAIHALLEHQEQQP